MLWNVVWKKAGPPALNTTIKVAMKDKFGVAIANS